MSRKDGAIVIALQYPGAILLVGSVLLAGILPERLIGLVVLLAVCGVVLFTWGCRHLVRHWPW